MNNREYHILNGDCLKEQFPHTLEGELIVFRECLVDGPVAAKSMEELYTRRAHFIATYHTNFKEETYYQKTVSEIEKIKDIPSGSKVNLWFEDDLFCQVNLWFILSLLKNKNLSMFLIRPQEHTRYGFGKYTGIGLTELFQKKIPIHKDSNLFRLWSYYQENRLTELMHIAESLQDEYPFVVEAVIAHIERIPSKNSIGRPKLVLKAIRAELQTDDFGTLFTEFNKREPIYGFGDLQVKRLWDEMLHEI